LCCFSVHSSRAPLSPPSFPTRRSSDLFYSVTPVPDGSVWGSVLGFPGAAVRLVPGDDPPHTTLVEVYEPPFDNPKAKVQGFSPRSEEHTSEFQSRENLVCRLLLEKKKL